MGKKNRKRNVEEKTEDFGTCVLYCQDCNEEFEVDWEEIFEIQACTHGYVGFHLNDVFIECPICYEIISNNSQDEEYLPDNNKIKRSKPFEDNELPF